MRKLPPSSDGARTRGMPSSRRGALAALALMLQLGGAQAAGCPRIVFGTAYGSLDELAARTLGELLDDGGRYESGGFFIERKGVYHASRPVTQHARDAVNYCIVLPRDARLAGLYHTHVASSALSAPDRRNAERAGVPSYIGTLRDRSVWVYDARSREARLVEHAPQGGLATEGSPAESGSGDPRSLGERLAALQRRAAEALARLF